MDFFLIFLTLLLGISLGALVTMFYFFGYRSKNRLIQPGKGIQLRIKDGKRYLHGEVSDAILYALRREGVIKGNIDSNSSDIFMTSEEVKYKVVEVLNANNIPFENQRKDDINK